MYNKVDLVEEVIHQNYIDVLCLTETWLYDSIQDSEIQIAGFNIFRKDHGSQGGSVALYVRHDIKTTVRNDLFCNDKIES